MKKQDTNLNKMLFFPCLDSTNAYIKRLFEGCTCLKTPGQRQKGINCLDRLTVVAGRQTKGVGRQGRQFFSPFETGVYFSMVIFATPQIKSPAFVTAFAAVAVCQAAKKLFAVDCQIKWVNDIFFEGKKVAGILTQGVQDTRGGILAYIVGVGINIAQNPALPQNLKTVAGGLLKTNDITHDTKQNLILLVKNTFFDIFDSQKQKTAIKEYQKLQFLVGSEIIVHPLACSNKGIYKAKVLDVDKNLCLVVKTNQNGTQKILHLNSGEVSLKSDVVTAFL